MVEVAIWEPHYPTVLLSTVGITCSRQMEVTSLFCNLMAILCCTITEAPCGRPALRMRQGIMPYSRVMGISLSTKAVPPFGILIPEGSGGDVLNVQNDGNVVIYLSNTALWNTATSANQRDCWTSDSCSPSDFAWELLGVTPQAPYPGGVNVWPLTLPNNYAVYTWTRAENTPLSIANPLATTQLEPGSYDYNPPAHVQVYTDSSGHTKWYWGIKATSDTVHNGFYQPIINVVQNPSSSSYQQCVNLGHAVGSTPWGTGDFSGDC